MKLGVVSDIHSNKIALDSVLSDMTDVDYKICCGDIVGYGPRPSECLELVRDEFDVVVKGNHDRMVNENPESYRSNNMAYRGLLKSQRTLNEEQKEWLDNLPQRTEWKDYLIAHSHPKITDMYVYPANFDEMIKYGSEFEGVMLGHTHVQGLKKFSECFVLNPGSVGQPRDENPQAAYSVIDTNNQDVELRRCDYDIETVKKQIEDEGLPSRTGDRLEKGE